MLRSEVVLDVGIDVGLFYLMPFSRIFENIFFSFTKLKKNSAQPL